MCALNDKTYLVVLSLVLAPGQELLSGTVLLLEVGGLCFSPEKGGEGGRGGGGGGEGGREGGTEGRKGRRVGGREGGEGEMEGGRSKSAQ